MRGHRFGCLTSSGIFTAFVVLFALAGVAFASGGRMFSAGELNAQPGESFGGVTSHAEITDCAACHVAPWETGSMAQRCVVCHQNIIMQTLDATSVHGAIAASRPNADCRECHPEHRGVAAALTKFDLAAFPHDILGFSLNKHQQVAVGQPFQCSDCHHNGYDFFQSTCDECHRKMDAAFMDLHAAQYGADCLACHDGVDALSGGIDHDAFFKLEGKHAAASCGGCHAGAHSRADFASAPSDCFSCHQKDDKHAGAFGTACGVCHNPAGWLPAQFDHNLAAFQLTGSHVSVACESCHVNGVFKGTPQDCYSCHQKNDKHNGQFGTNCAACHNTSTWAGASFDHNLAAFKLTGSHVSVACESCHVNGVFKGTPQDCYSCHQKNDKHNGQFGTNCAACHNTSTWAGASFDHNLAAFQLTGSHVSVACESCHVNGVFKGTPQDCYSCHQKNDKHNGQFGTNCAACHNTSTWTGASFDHNLAAFKLTGSHVSVACGSCHVNGVFKGTPQDCYSCHQKNDKHNGQFGTNCAACHNTSTWTGASFDHNLAAFKLTGSHVSVACGSCHVNGVFKGTTQSCAACHQKDDRHNGQFGECSGCHNTSTWAGVSFNHNITAFPLTGQHINVRCESCHIGGVFKGTPQSCYACHKQHDAHGGRFGTDCGACHTTSNWNSATFDHSRTNFPLTGGHGRVACESCHRNGQFSGLSTACASCHADPGFHAGAFGTNCAGCHNVSAWKPAGFNLYHPQPQTDEGGSGVHHGGASCRTCHPSSVFQSTCVACHSNGFEGGDDGDGGDDDD